MSVESVERVTVTCDRCGRCAVDDRGVPQHWLTKDQAISQISGPVFRWLADRETQLCPACVAQARCRAQGHQWGPWSELPEYLEPAGAYIRLCERCEANEIADMDPSVRTAS